MQRFLISAALLLLSFPLFASTESWLNSILAYLPNWTMTPYFTLTLWQWMGLGVAIVIGIVVRFIVNIILKGIHGVASRKTKTKWDDLILEAFIGPTGILVAAGVWYLSIYLLDFNTNAAGFFGVIVQIIFSIGFIILFYRLTNVLIEFFNQLAEKTESDLDDQLMPVVEKTLRFLVIVIGVLITLQNLGINVVSALAGLGIGGLAFALAAKDTAANMFGSFTIFMDQPFKLGDWVIINGSHEGIIETIGIRTTRIRTFNKTIISLPNAVVANSSIENISRRPYRRTVGAIGLTYDTTAEKMDIIVDKIRKIITGHKATVDDGFHISFAGYGASSLDIKYYFFMKVADWAEELKFRQEIMLDIMRAVEAEGLEFAFPTQTLHVESMPK